MMTTKRNKDDEDNGDRVLRDGESLRTSLMMMDGKTVEHQTTILADGKPESLHRPGWRFTATDAVAETKKQMARDEYERNLCDAWRTAAPGPISVTTEDLLDSEFDDSANPYEAYDRHISQAWRRT